MTTLTRTKPARVYAASRSRAAAKISAAGMRLPVRRAVILLTSAENPGGPPVTVTPDRVMRSFSAPAGASSPGCPEKLIADPPIAAGGLKLGGVIWLAVCARIGAAAKERTY